ncbi:MAG: STAS/SEC14 domain-containing protein [Polyangiales bacterium]
MNKTNAEGRADTKHLEGRIVETTYYGKLIPELVDQVRRDVEAELRKIGGGDWLCDVSLVEGFKAAPSGAANTFFSSFRAAGGRRIAVAVASSPVRMVGSALAFAVGQDIKWFANREDALRHLRSSS